MSCFFFLCRWKRRRNKYINSYSFECCSLMLAICRRGAHPLCSLSVTLRMIIFVFIDIVFKIFKLCFFFLSCLPFFFLFFLYFFSLYLSSSFFFFLSFVFLFSLYLFSFIFYFFYLFTCVWLLISIFSIFISSIL